MPKTRSATSAFASRRLSAGGSWREAQAEFRADGASPFRDLPPTARHAVCGMGPQLVHLQPCSSVPDFPFRRGREDRAGRYPRGPTGFREEHAVCCPAGARLAAAVGRVGFARSGTWAAAAGTAAGGTEGRLYRTDRGIAAESRGSGASSPRRTRGTLAHLRPPTDAVERQAEPALPGWVVFPTHAENADTRLVPLRKAAGFLRLEKNCFNYDALGRPAFDALSQLIDTSECYELPFAQATGAARTDRRHGRAATRAGLAPRCSLTTSCCAPWPIPRRLPDWRSGVGSCCWRRRAWQALPRGCPIGSRMPRSLTVLPPRVRTQFAAARAAAESRPASPRVGGQPAASRAHRDRLSNAAAKGRCLCRGRRCRWRAAAPAPTSILWCLATSSTGSKSIFWHMAGSRSSSNLYDARYYRRWSHELPPMRHRDRGSVLDVHHTILPPSSRLRPDPALFWRAAVSLPDGSMAFCPAHMALHVAVHLFQDGEIAGGLGDLIDFDELCRYFGRRPGFWEQLVPAAVELGTRSALAVRLALYFASAEDDGPRRRDRRGGTRRKAVCAGARRDGPAGAPRARPGSPRAPVAVAGGCSLLPLRSIALAAHAATAIGAASVA